MQSTTLYEYHGISYTLNELARMSHIHRDTILRRLDWGMTVEEALDQPNSRSLPMLSRSDIGKHVPIVFNTFVPVKQEMQPILGKQYIAKICGSPHDSQQCRVFYLVELENGKPLITYPGEFDIVGEFIEKAEGA